MHLLSQAKNNVSALALMRHLGVSYPTVWLVKHKLMQVMAERERARVLEGRVEIDDAYLGGEHPGGRRGRGSEGKWLYLEHDWVAEEGSYIFEPPGETHTLVVPDDGKEMITMFQVNGTLVYIDPHGKTLR